MRAEGRPAPDGEIAPVISSGQFGWLLTVYSPVFDSQGVCQCYVGVDIRMEHIRRSGIQFLARVVSLFFVFLLMLLTVTILFAEHNIILPINALASRRSYKEPFSFEEAMRIIQEDSGIRFDPAIVDAFCRAGEEVRRIMNSVLGS